MTTMDDIQHRMFRDPARFVEDVRTLEGGRVEARLWSLDRQQPVWVPVQMAAGAGRLIVWFSSRQPVLAIDTLGAPR